jgi:hypothetical protein
MAKGRIARRIGMVKAGTTVVIVDIHKGAFGGVIKLSVRDPKTGKYFRRVPVEVFAR